MSTSNLLDQDFGSDSDEADFNPAPADDSDGAESAGDDEEPASLKHSKVRAEDPQRKVREEVYDDGEEDSVEDYKARSNGHRNGARSAGGSEDGENEAGVSSKKRSGGGSKQAELDDEDLDDEDDEDDEEDDDEDEDEVSVRLFFHLMTSSTQLTKIGSSNEAPAPTSKSIPGCRGCCG